jgi:hypothetical protein
MKYEMTKPCGNCPFSNDKIFPLRPERVREMIHAPFPCHKTVDYDSDEEEGIKRHDNEQHCAGSLIMHEKMEQPHQMMRICERVGLYDRTKLDMDAPVFNDDEEMREAFQQLEDDRI